MTYNTANVGIAILIYNKEGQILLGKRISKLGNSTWAPPGGKLERGEKIEDSITRETEEETGMFLKTMKFNCITNDVFEDGNHFVTIYMDAIEIEGEPVIMEPEKCEEWRYFDLNNLPEPLFLCFENFINGNKYN
jgi:8-oxo-dGTP diphosphatase